MEIKQRIYNQSNRVYESIEQCEKFSKIIWELLGSRGDIYYDHCDALYFDFSVLPEEIQKKFHRDAYLIFGITDKGEFVSEWIERWELDR